MSKPSMYVLLLPASLHAADVPATVLHLTTRGHRRPLASGECRAERDELAGVVGPGPLADLLRSDRPVSVGTRGADRWDVRAW